MGQRTCMGLAVFYKIPLEGAAAALGSSSEGGCGQIESG